MAERAQRWNHETGRYEDVTDPAEAAEAAARCVYPVEPKKPWEEEWEYFEANRGFPGFAALLDAGGRCSVFEALGASVGGDAARAKLAAAAPDMARLLLKYEWGGINAGRGLCPSCGATAVLEGYGNPVRDGVHRDGCEWTATMRKAGVR